MLVFLQDHRFFADGRNLFEEPGAVDRSNAGWISFTPHQLPSISTSARIVALLAAALLLLLPLGARAADAVELEVLGELQRGMEPGAVLTFGVRVDGKGRVHEALTLPDGWRTLGALGAVEAPETRLVTVVVPRRARAGRHELVYSVRSDEGQVLGVARVQVDVAERRDVRLELLPDSRPDLLRAGEAFEARAVVVNEGNHPVRLRIEAYGEEHLTVTVAPAALDLDPGEQATVTVEGRTSRAETREDTRYVRLRVHHRDELVQHRAFPVHVLPVRSERSFDGLPAAASLFVTGSGDEIAVQPEIVARGPVDRARQVELDLLVRGPDAMASGPFGQRDELRLNLATSWSRLRLGDQPYGMTWLTHPGRYGRGVELAFQRYGVLAGAHHVRSRWDGGATRASGVQLGHVGARGQVTTQVLATQREGAPDELVGTVASAVTPSRPR